MNQEEKIVVIGLGYVGLPLAVALARHHAHVVGFDISARRVEELREGLDRTNETDPAELRTTPLRLTSDLAEVGPGTFFIVTVPTPIDANRQPDLGPILRGTETVAKLLQPGAVVVYESTVYPGVTEDVCAPLLEKASGLSRAQFRLGYSPERINPGDREHTLETTVKIVAGEDDETLERVARVYESIVKPGVHRAPSIKVAEAAKVIENTQRDLNIALMNELAMIFDRMGIRTRDVLDAAGTKWNFLRFSPGLVGGHCIGVDPYYLTSKAENLGYHPAIILAGRRVNDGMGAYVARRMVREMIAAGAVVKGAKVGILGLTFKENVPDLRSSRVPDIVAELRSFGVEPLVHDPRADAAEAMHEYGLELVGMERFVDLDGLVLAVAHREYRALAGEPLARVVKPGGVVGDVKSFFDAGDVPALRTYWVL